MGKTNYSPQGMVTKNYPLEGVVAKICSLVGMVAKNCSLVGMVIPFEQVLLALQVDRVEELLAM